MQRRHSSSASFAVTTKKPTSTQPLETGAFFFAFLFALVLPDLADAPIRSFKRTSAAEAALTAEVLRQD
jgi:hypothetical protein